MTTASTIARFTPALPPQPLAHEEIHLWFFPQWEKTSDAARSAPVRGLLAAYLDRPVDTVRIERGEHGKPRLTGGELEFNLAHTGAALLLGISHDVVLGVDLENAQRRTRSIELAGRFFTPAETAALESLPDELCQATFLRLWCAKEAALKAQGRGIGFGLDRVEFDIDAAGAVAPVAGNPWRLVALAPSTEHVGALAHAGLVSRVCAFVARN